MDARIKSGHDLLTRRPDVLTGCGERLDAAILS